LSEYKNFDHIAMALNIITNQETMAGIINSKDIVILGTCKSIRDGNDTYNTNLLSNIEPSFGITSKRLNM
jgi:hypothetical protein